MASFLFTLTLLLFLHIGTLHATDQHICPSVLRCECDFHNRMLTCFNVTSIPDVPSWVNTIVLKDGDTIALTRAGHIPKHIYVFGIDNYQQVEITGDYFKRGSNMKGFSLQRILKARLINVFKNTRQLTGIKILNCKSLNLETGAFKGLRLKLLSLSEVSISCEQCAEIMCSIDPGRLQHIQLSAVGLTSVPHELAACLQQAKLISLNLNRNNFSTPGSLDALGLLKQIRQISLSSSNITRSLTLDFLRGKHVTTIDISNNGLPAQQVKDILCLLDPKVIKTITASGNSIGYIKDDFLECLANARLRDLILRGGNITGLSKNALRMFQETLNVDLEGNAVPVDKLSFMGPARYVQSLHLSNNRLTRFPDFKVNGTCLPIQGLADLHLVNNLISSVTEEETECLRKLVILTLTRNRIIVLSSRAFRKLTNLKQLSLGRNNMVYLGWDSLPLGLISLDLVENNFNYHGLNVVGQLENLYKFTISGTDGLSSRIFENKSKLETLRIADGRVASGELRGILHTVTSVQSLQLMNLNLHAIPAEILGLQNLQTLYLTNNKIDTVPSYLIPKLNRLRDFGVSFNLLECNCSLLPFSQWLRNDTRPTRVHNLQHTTCFSPSRYEHTPLFNFDKDCRDLLPIILPSVIVPFVLLIVIITAVSVRYRGYIRYGLMLFGAKWRGYGALEGHSFRYDAFVSYNREDAHWVVHVLRPKLEDETGYRICLHDRDFTAGGIIVDNIIQSIEESRKTILVMSDNFAKSEWCQLEMTLAQHKLFEDKRDVLIMVRLAEVAEENVTNTMRMLMHTKTYITWPQTGEGLDLFWRNLIFALRRPPGVIMEEQPDVQL